MALDFLHFPIYVLIPLLSAIIAGFLLSYVDANIVQEGKEADNHNLDVIMPYDIDLQGSKEGSEIDLGNLESKSAMKNY